MCQGKPFIKPKNTLGAGDVGIDIGPSTIAIVADEESHLKQLASELEFDATCVDVGLSLNSYVRLNTCITSLDLF